MAVVVANYIRSGKTARAKAKATVLYNAERVGRDKEALSRILFGWQGVMDREEAELLIDRAGTSTVFFRVMINFDPVKEDPDKLLNIWEIVRKTYEELGRALGLEGKIQFIAALHDDHTALRHIHSLMLVPHRLSKEQFRALAYIPRVTATGEALRQRHALALRQRQTLNPSQQQVPDRHFPRLMRREHFSLSRTPFRQLRASAGGYTQRIERKIQEPSVLVKAPPNCPFDETRMKRMKQGGYRCPQCGWRQEQELSFEQ